MQAWTAEIWPRWLFDATADQMREDGTTDDPAMLPRALKQQRQTAKTRGHMSKGQEINVALAGVNYNN